MERLLNRMNLFPFRCQLCTNQFRAFRPGTRSPSQAFDRRQYKRLSANFPAMSIVEEPRAKDVVTDLSMDGCTLQTSSALPRGSFLQLQLNPASGQEPISVETAMVCSVRPTSMGIRFLEFHPEDRRRLSQLVLGLLIVHHTSSSV